MKEGFNMNLLKNHKLKALLRILIVIISIIEARIIFSFSSKYPGIISYSVFTSSILLQIFLGFYLTSTKAKKYTNTQFNLNTSLLIAALIAVPFFIFGALPKYTYEKGKDLLTQYLNTNSAIEFTSKDDIIPTLPVIPYTKGFPKVMLWNNKFYYYEVKINENHRFFAINPLTGEIIELKKNFYDFK